MIIKKYQGKTEFEATELAKKELGLNVVVMNVKSVKRKGILHLFQSPKIEVTVALEEENERQSINISTTKRQAESAEQTIQSAQPFQKKKPFSMTGTGIIPDSLLSETMVQNGNEENGKAIEEKLDSLQELLEKQLSKPEKDKEEILQEEELDENMIFMQLLYNTMLENEVDEKYANQIIDEFGKNNKSEMPIDYILANIYQKMILKFGKPSGISPAENGPKVVFFVGPTGVGKTTTIAKIASKFRVDEKKKVALLTADTYRIAAAEQLRTYANILDVPFRVIYSVDEIQAALTDFREFDYMLVDTAGHSHHNEVQKENMNLFIHSLDGKAEKEVFLVVSATTKYRDLLSIADTYITMTDYKLIFTKLDETTTLGNLLNVKLYTGASLSYVTCGQNVPDDIENFDPQSTVKQLLGGKH